MNWVLVGVVIVLLFHALIGMRKGMLRIILSLAAVVVTIVVTMALTPAVSDYVKKNTNWYNKIKETTHSSALKNNLLENSFNTLGYEDIPGTEVSQENLNEAANQVISKLSIPEGLKKQLNIDLNVESAVLQGANSVKDMVMTVLTERISEIIFKIIVFAIVFLLVYIIMQIIIRVIDIVSMLPIVKQVNKAGGLLLGLIRGLVIVWIFFIIMTVACNTGFAHTVFSDINESAFLTFLYNNNFILKLIFYII